MVQKSLGWGLLICFLRFSPPVRPYIQLMGLFYPIRNPFISLHFTVILVSVTFISSLDEQTTIQLVFLFLSLPRSAFLTFCLKIIQKCLSQHIPMIKSLPVAPVLAVWHDMQGLSDPAPACPSPHSHLSPLFSRNLCCHHPELFGTPQMPFSPLLSDLAFARTAAAD